MSTAHLGFSTPKAALANVVLFPVAPSLASLFISQPTETFEAGEAIFWEGDAATHVFHVTKGCLRLCRLLPDGRRAVMGFAFAGEVLGISCPKTYHHTAEAIGEVRVRRVSRVRFTDAVDASPILRPQLLAKMYEDMSAAQQHMVLLSRLSAEERVVNFLVSTAKRTLADMHHPIAIELPMSRLDIGDYLGLTIETVCRVLSKLKREGQIVLEGRSHIILRRIDALQELCGGLEDGEESIEFAPARRAH